VTANLKDAPIDDAHVVMDTDAVRMVFNMCIYIVTYYLVLGNGIIFGKIVF